MQDDRVQSNKLTLRGAIRFTSRNRIRVLLVEDDIDTRETLVQAMTRDGFDVVAAQDGLEALRVVRTASASDDSPGFDVVVADVLMPGLTGLQLLEAMQRADEAPPFVLITGHGTARVHEEAMRLGAGIVIDKPFALGDLEYAVERFGSVGDRR